METTTAPHRSAFVTVVAWIFIVLATLASTVGVLQNIAFFKMAAMPDGHGPMHGGAAQLPWLLRLIFDHFQLYLAIELGGSLTGLVAAVGLLKRKNWARRLFIALLCLGMAVLVVALATQLSFTPVTDNIPAAQVPENVRTMLRVMKGFFFILTLLLSLLLSWIIATLAGPRIKEEFQA